MVRRAAERAGMRKSRPSVDQSRDESAALYLFYGDEYLVKEQVAQIVDRVLPGDIQQTNLFVIEGHSLDAGALVALVVTPSLFGTSRVIIVDQTTVFMDRGDRKKLLSKTLQTWKAGDRRATMRGLSQVLSLSGLTVDDMREPQWVDEVLGDTTGGEDRETLAAAGRAFLEEGRSIQPAGGEDLIEELISSEFPPGTVLIFTAQEVETRKKLFKLISERGRVVHCAVQEQKYGGGLDRSFLENRIKHVVTRAGKRIGRAAMDRIYSRCGTDLRRIHAELDKLIVFVGERQEVRVDDVDAIFTDFHEASFFDLTNALRSGDISKALPALHEHLKISAHPLQTLGIIASDFRKLMVARELLFTVFKTTWRAGMSYDQFKEVVAQARRDHPELTGNEKFKLLSSADYSLYLLLRDAQKFPMEKLIRMMEACLDADIQLKSSRLGNRSPQAILENLVSTVCAPVRGQSPRMR